MDNLGFTRKLAWHRSLLTHFKIVSFRKVLSTFLEKFRGKNIVNNIDARCEVLPCFGRLQVWMNKISDTAYTISVRD